jgi:hypothetical protein
VSSYVSAAEGVPTVAVVVEVAGRLGVLVRRTILVEVLVVFGFVRMIGVGIEEVGETASGVMSGGASTGGSVGTGIPDSSVRGVVIAGSVPR